MASQTLLTLKEKPSFEGELSIELVKENDSGGRAKYSLVCQKNPPLNERELLLIPLLREDGADDDLREITKSIKWQREVPEANLRNILTRLQHEVVAVVPDRVLGFDGTSYELIINRGFNGVQFVWWCEAPQAWKVLGEAAKTILTWADSASIIETLQSDNRKQLITRLERELGELQVEMQKEAEQSRMAHNRRCQVLARALGSTGLTCPACGRHSTEIRFVDKSAVAKSYFICNACGRSFRPEDL
jgi:hypothetical protein